MPEIDPTDPYSICESMNNSVADWLKDLESRNYRYSADKMELIAGFLRTYVSVNKSLVSDAKSKDQIIRTLTQGLIP